MDDDFRKKISSEFLKQLGQNIRNARGKKFSQASLGTAVGLTRTSINNIEHGRQRIMVDTLFLISTILEVPLVKLLPEVRHEDNVMTPSIPSNLPDSVKTWIEVVYNK